MRHLDIEVSYYSSFAFITPMTALGEDWVNDNVNTEPWQWNGLTLTSERNYAPEIVRGARAAGIKAGSRK